MYEKKICDRIRRLGGHEIDGVDCPQRHSVVGTLLVAHNAHRAHVGQRGKILADAPIQPGIGNLPRGRWRPRPARWRTFSAVTSPMMSMPSPWPGKG